LPAFREAVLFNFLDDLDSKMGAMRATLAAEGGEAGWTAYNPALERRLLRLEEFLAGPKTPGKAAAAAPQGQLPLGKGDGE
jgi:hypothetical protein